MLRWSRRRVDAVAALFGKAPTPKRRVHLRHYRLPRRKIPPIEGSEVDESGCLEIDISKPRYTAVGRFRHRSLHVKVEDRFGTTSADFRDAPPLCITESRGRIAAVSLTHEIDIRMVIIRRPMALKVLQKRSPIERRTILCEVAKRREKPWSILTSVGTSSDRTSANQSAIPRRVQYFFAPVGGNTSIGGVSLSAI
jgi:hypothetical protein